LQTVLQHRYGRAKTKTTTITTNCGFTMTTRIPSLCPWKLPLVSFYIFALASCLVTFEAAAFTPHSVVLRQSPKSVCCQDETLNHPFTLSAIAGSEEEGIAKKELRGGAETTPRFWNKKIFREMIAELMGTFIIVFIGTGAVSSAIFTDSLVGLFQIASVWIIAVTIAICTTASISGAHLNPAISFAFALLRPSKSFGWSKVLPYAFAQCLGAVLGSWTNLAMYASSISAFENANGIARASVAGIASAKAFGEYFGYVLMQSRIFSIVVWWGISHLVFSTCL
jgi:hypothetical protein